MVPWHRTRGEPGRTVIGVIEGRLTLRHSAGYVVVAVGGGAARC